MEGGGLGRSCKGVDWVIDLIRGWARLAEGS